MIDRSQLLTPEFWASVDIENALLPSYEKYPYSGRSTAFHDLSRFLLSRPEELRYTELSTELDGVLLANESPLKTIASVTEAVVIADSFPLDEKKEADVIITDRMYIHGLPGLWFCANRRALTDDRKRRKGHSVAGVHGPDLRLGKWAQITFSTDRKAYYYRELTGLWIPPADI